VLHALYDTLHSLSSDPITFFPTLSLLGNNTHSSHPVALLRIRVRHSSDSLAPRAKASAQILLGPLRHGNLHTVP